MDAAGRPQGGGPRDRAQVEHLRLLAIAARDPDPGPAAAEVVIEPRGGVIAGTVRRGQPDPAVAVGRDRRKGAAPVGERDPGPGPAIPAQEDRARPVRAAVILGRDVGPDVTRPGVRQAVDIGPEQVAERHAKVRQRGDLPPAPVPVLDAKKGRAVAAAADPHVAGGARSARRAAERERPLPPRSAVEVGEVPGGPGPGRFAERPQLRRGGGDRRRDRGIEPDRRGPALPGQVQRVGVGNLVGATRGQHPGVRARGSRDRGDTLVERAVDVRTGRRHNLPRPAVPVPHDDGAVAGVSLAARRRVGALVPGQPGIPRAARPQPAHRHARQHLRDPPASRAGLPGGVRHGRRGRPGHEAGHRREGRQRHNPASESPQHRSARRFAGTHAHNGHHIGYARKNSRDRTSAVAGASGGGPARQKAVRRGRWPAAPAARRR